MFILSCKIVHIASGITIDKIIIWFIFGTLGGMVMSAIQLMISLFMKSFALPVAITLCGVISGLVFLAKGLGHIFLIH